MTSGVVVVVAAWRTLEPAEREEALALLTDLHERDQAGSRSETEELLEGMRLAAEHVGGTLSPGSYDRARGELRDAGVVLPPRSRIMRHFDSWRGAKEALGLYASPSKPKTARQIEARFATRQLGKVWRYTPESLAETMRLAVEHWGRPPRIAEFDHWRTRELELRRARGETHPHLPSESPYRKRWGSWDAALLGLGYSPEWIAERFDVSVAARRAQARHEGSSGG